MPNNRAATIQLEEGDEGWWSSCSELEAPEGALNSGI